MHSIWNHEWTFQQYVPSQQFHGMCTVWSNKDRLFVAGFLYVLETNSVEITIHFDILRFWIFSLVNSKRRFRGTLQTGTAMETIRAFSCPFRARTQKQSLCQFDTDSVCLKNGRTKDRVRIGFLRKFAKTTYLYPQPLMHIRHRIWNCRDKKRGHRQDRLW